MSSKINKAMSKIAINSMVKMFMLGINTIADIASKEFEKDLRLSEKDKKRVERSAKKYLTRIINDKK